MVSDVVYDVDYDDEYDDTYDDNAMGEREPGKLYNRRLNNNRIHFLSKVCYHEAVGTCSK
jgi:hypothetical protein